MRSRLFSLLVALVAFQSIEAQTITVVAGGGTAEKDAPATECRLHEPFGVEFTPGGEMVIVEAKGQRVLKVNKEGQLSVIAGTGAKGYSGDDGPASAATFNGVHNLAITSNGDIFLSDAFNHALRKIDAATATISTVAGNGKKGFGGDDGPGAQGQFSTLIQVALDSSGKSLLLTDIGNRRIRKFDIASGVVSTVAGNGQKGAPAVDADAKAASLVDPRAAIADGKGGIYVLERGGNALRHVNAEGKIRTVAGTGKPGPGADSAPALEATFKGPKHLCMDRDGSVLIADSENHVICRYDPVKGVVTRVAGTGQKGSNGVGGDPLKCELNRPHGVTIGPDGSLFIVDSDNNHVLKVSNPAKKGGE